MIAPDRGLALLDSWEPQTEVWPHWTAESPRDLAPLDSWEPQTEVWPHWTAESPRGLAQLDSWEPQTQVWPHWTAESPRGLAQLDSWEPRQRSGPAGQLHMPIWRITNHNYHTMLKALFSLQAKHEKHEKHKSCEVSHLEEPLKEVYIIYMYQISIYCNRHHSLFISESVVPWWLRQHSAQTRSQGCNTITTRLERAVTPLQPSLAQLSSANNVISRAYVWTLAFLLSSKRQFSLL